MIDLHSHTIFSDGVLIPSELARRAEDKGVKVIGMSDHGDASNIDFIIPRILETAEELNKVMDIKVIAGIELTHVPPKLISNLAIKARKLGAEFISVHGETIVEPVKEGTNSAALYADIDILSHPGLITEEEVLLAKENGICLEITTRKGHSLTNGHVAKLAKKVGAKMVINTDTHTPSDLVDSNSALKVVKGCGLSEKDFNEMQENAYKLCKLK